MKLIFKPEDFKYIASKEIWEFAQAKFDSWLAEQKVVWGSGRGGWTELPSPMFLSKDSDLPAAYSPTHKAILVCIEPIEQCKHPKEKVLHSISNIPLVFQCECGAKVKPKEFEVCE